MAKAIVDPIELRRFAHHLKQFNADVRDRVVALHAQLIALGDTWRDQEHDKFTQQFEETMLVVNHFLEGSDQHVPLLLRKAERIEEYLQQH
jgi:Proteins of 100 residues with WXG